MNFNSLKRFFKLRWILAIIFTMILNLLFSTEITHKVQRPSNIYIGTPFHLHVDITTAPQDSVFTTKKDTIDVFQVLNITDEKQVIEEKNEIVHKLNFTLAAFDTGSFIFPEMEFTVKKNNGEIETLKTDKFTITVQSVLIDSSSVIKDIAKPIKLKLGFWDYFIPILTLILLTLLIYYIIKKSKNKEKKVSENVIIDSRPPFQKALEKLDILKNKKLIEKGEFIEFFYELSMILRFFLENEYGFNAMEMTTSEIKDFLPTDDSVPRSQIFDLLIYADKVKFAKFIPLADDARAYLAWIESYLKSFEKKYFNSDEEVKNA